MVNEKYLRVAKKLADRIKNRLNAEKSPREQEIDGLFFWIMSRLELAEKNCWIAKTHHNVTVKVIIKEEKCNNEDQVLLKHGTSQYISKYVTKKEFYSVMKEVTDIFNKIGKQEKDGYQYHAVCFTTRGYAKLIVNLATKI